VAEKSSSGYQDASFSAQAKGTDGSFLEEQLERLKTNYLDFYLLHGLNGETWDRMQDLGVREFLDKKKSEGKLRFPAFSFHGKLKILFVFATNMTGLLRRYSIIIMDTDFQAGYKGLKYAADRGIGIVVMEPLKGGKLAQNLPAEMMSVFNNQQIKEVQQSGHCVSCGTRLACQAFCQE